MSKRDLRWYEKLSLFVGIVAGICAITGYTMRDIVDKPSTTEIESETTTETTSETTAEIESETTTEGVVETIPESVADKERMAVESVEEEVKRIRKKYYSFQEEKETLKRNNLNSDVIIYYKENRVALIEILPGYTGVKYSRMYYFDENSKLYFAFVFEKKRENRLYVKDDVIIRYINENSEVFDYGNEMNCNGLDELALSESYGIFNSLNQE